MLQPLLHHNCRNQNRHDSKHQLRHSHSRRILLLVILRTLTITTTTVALTTLAVAAAALAITARPRRLRIRTRDTNHRLQPLHRIRIHRPAHGARHGAGDVAERLGPVGGEGARRVELGALGPRGREAEVLARGVLDVFGALIPVLVVVDHDLLPGVDPEEGGVCVWADVVESTREVRVSSTFAQCLLITRRGNLHRQRGATPAALTVSVHLVDASRPLVAEMLLTGLESSSQRRLRNHDVLIVTRARTRRIIRGGKEGDFINIHVEARLSHVRDECLVFTAIHLRREE